MEVRLHRPQGRHQDGAQARRQKGRPGEARRQGEPLRKAAAAKEETALKAEPAKTMKKQEESPKALKKQEESPKTLTKAEPAPKRRPARPQRNKPSQRGGAGCPLFLPFPIYKNGENRYHSFKALQRKGGF